MGFVRKLRKPMKHIVVFYFIIAPNLLCYLRGLCANSFVLTDHSFFKSKTTLAFFCSLDEIKSLWRWPAAVMIMTEVLGGIEPEFSATIIISWCD